MKKKRMAQSGPMLISEMASVMATNASPGPDFKFSNFVPKAEGASEGALVCSLHPSAFASVHTKSLYISPRCTS